MFLRRLQLLESNGSWNKPRSIPMLQLWSISPMAEQRAPTTAEASHLSPFSVYLSYPQIEISAFEYPATSDLTGTILYHYRSSFLPWKKVKQTIAQHKATRSFVGTRSDSSSTTDYLCEQYLMSCVCFAERWHANSEGTITKTSGQAGAGHCRRAGRS